MQTVLLSAKFLRHILGGPSCDPQSSGIYSGQYDRSLHRMYIPDLKFQLFFQFLLEILIDMVYNILVVGYSWYFNYTTKKDCCLAFFCKIAVFFVGGFFYSPFAFSFYIQVNSTTKSAPKLKSVGVQPFGFGKGWWPSQGRNSASSSLKFAYIKRSKSVSPNTEEKKQMNSTKPQIKKAACRKRNSSLS